MSIRDRMDAEYRLKRAKRPLKMKREVSSGSSLFYCPSCGAPVVDSQVGRDLHALRMVACAEAMRRVTLPKSS
jgi:hypothetical protein